MTDSATSTDTPHSRISRRAAIQRAGTGFGMLALAGLARAAERDDAAASQGQHPFDHTPRAKAVIFLFMNGGLSHVDSFDYKPALDKYHGKDATSDLRLERRRGTLMRSPFSFERYGECGAQISELFPRVGAHADRLCFVNSMHTDVPNHEPSLLMMNTGHGQIGRPSLGSWLTYGLGSENANLPGYVVLSPGLPTTVGPPLWHSAFLPTNHQGTFVSSKAERRTPKSGAPPRRSLLPFLSDPRSTDAESLRQHELRVRLERARAEPGDALLESRIRSMEVAFRMQTEAPEVFDLSAETEATRTLYGEGSMACSCLTAVRLVERGVRMVQVYAGDGDPWDHHGDIGRHRNMARHSDQAYAAVIADLESRGLLDSTLVVCASEFGRTPTVEIGAEAGGQFGRDHNPYGFTAWLAGGGVRGGMSYGSTDELGFAAAENPVHVHDLHATTLHLLGIDHTRLTYRHAGRDFRLTDVSGRVIHDILA